MKTVLVILSEWGYWGEVLDQKGISVDFVTNKDKLPLALLLSMQVDFFDPPLHKVVRDEKFAILTYKVDESDRLGNPINLSGWFPEWPYSSENSFVKENHFEDWLPDRTQMWQQNRDVVGSNLKIAWNMTGKLSVTRDHVRVIERVEPAQTKQTGNQKLLGYAQMFNH